MLPLFSPMAKAPAKKYRTLVADPPWHYDHSWNAYRGSGKERSVTEAGDYPTMSIDELMNMPVGHWAEDRAHLYLWTTHAYLVPAHRIAAAWGFDVKTILIWTKRRPTNDAWLGMGTYFRSVHEYVIFATRGNMPTLRNDEATVFYAPRGEHSAKPSAFYDMVARMSPGPFLDVFARKQRMMAGASFEVMDTFGNESFNFGTSLPPEHFTGAAS
jgi:N6-adenosine-specific RNA methylase IME4